MLGFPQQTWLPADEVLATQFLGHSVSPFQVAPLLFALWKCHPRELLSNLVKYRLFGLPPLSLASVVQTEDLKRRVFYDRPKSLHPRLGPVQLLSCGTVLCPYLSERAGSLCQTTNDLCHSLMMRDLAVSKWDTRLLENLVQHFVTLKPLKVKFLQGDFEIALSPLCSVADVVPEFACPVLDQFGSFRDLLWTFGKKSIVVDTFQRLEERPVSSLVLT